MNNSIDISKLKYSLKDRLYLKDNALTNLKMDNKTLKIINEKLSVLVYDYINNLVSEYGYKDFDLKPLTFKLLTTIDKSNNLFNYEIQINNEHININDKNNIITMLYNNTILFEYDEDFIKLVKYTFKDTFN